MQNVHLPTHLEFLPEVKQIHPKSGRYLIFFTDDFAITMQNA